MYTFNLRPIANIKVCNSIMVFNPVGWYCFLATLRTTHSIRHSKREVITIFFIFFKIVIWTLNASCYSTKHVSCCVILLVDHVPLTYFKFYFRKLIYYRFTYLLLGLYAILGSSNIKYKHIYYLEDIVILRVTQVALICIFEGYT